MGNAAAELIDLDIKRDERGRRIVPAIRRAGLVRAYRASGLTMVQFARREGINHLTLAKWSSQQRREGTKLPVRFEEMKLGMSGSGWAYEVTLPNGMAVRASNAPALVQLLELIRR